LALVAPASASTRTYFGFHVGIGDAPPPPVVYFRSQPRFVFVPNSDVYIVRSSYDYDIFRYGPYYYACDNGYWYRARGYRGPFRVIDVRHVPRSVFLVPEGHWKHHWRDGRTAWRDDDDDRGKNRGHHRGRGHGDRD